jgi:hypothetical protein
MSIKPHLLLILLSLTAAIKAQSAEPQRYTVESLVENPAELSPSLTESDIKDAVAEALKRFKESRASADTEVIIDFQNYKANIDRSISLTGLPKFFALENLNIFCQKPSSSTAQKLVYQDLDKGCYKNNIRAFSDETSDGSELSIGNSCSSHQFIRPALDFTKSGNIQRLRLNSILINGKNNCDGLVINGNAKDIYLKDVGIYDPRLFGFVEMSKNRRRSLTIEDSRFYRADAKIPFGDRAAVAIASQSRSTTLKNSFIDYFRVGVFSTSTTNHIEGNHLCAGSGDEDASGLPVDRGGGIVPNVFIKNGSQWKSNILSNYIDNGHLRWETDSAELRGLKVLNNHMITHAPGSESVAGLNYFFQIPDMFNFTSRWGNKFLWLRLVYPKTITEDRTLRNFSFIGNALTMGDFKSTTPDRYASAVGSEDRVPIANLIQTFIQQNAHISFFNSVLEEPHAFKSAAPVYISMVNYPVVQKIQILSPSQRVARSIAEMPFGCTAKDIRHVSISGPVAARVISAEVVDGNATFEFDRAITGELSFEVFCEEVK